ncbi:hypothetical protein [Micromonospora sp. CA-111912]|uniref:hypothetical protein n=1 Tax=Micromonospora sp. CA-111912 TaxID=3239955 RepID=UPI003D8C0C80
MAMPNAIDAQRLSMAKRALLTAERHAADLNNRAARIAGVVMYDFAIEATMKATISTLGGTRLAKDFPGLLSQLDQVLADSNQPSLQARLQILQLRDIRNAAQHGARYPNRSELAEAKRNAYEALAELFDRGWRVDFSSYSLVSLIQGDRLQRSLARAEMELNLGHWHLAAVWAASAYFEALNEATEPLVGSLSHSFSLSPVTLKSEDPDGVAAKMLGESLVRMQETLEVVAMGLDLGTHVRIRATVGEMRTIPTDGPPLFHDAKSHISEADASFIFNECLQAVLKIEDRVGDIFEPFGMAWSVDTEVDDLAEEMDVNEFDADAAFIPEMRHFAFEDTPDDSVPRRIFLVCALRAATDHLNPEIPEHSKILAVTDRFVQSVRRYRNDLSVDETDRANYKILLACVAKATGKDLASLLRNSARYPR